MSNEKVSEATQAPVWSLEWKYPSGTRGIKMLIETPEVFRLLKKILEQPVELVAIWRIQTGPPASITATGLDENDNLISLREVETASSQESIGVKK